MAVALREGGIDQQQHHHPAQAKPKGQGGEAAVLAELQLMPTVLEQIRCTLTRNDSCSTR